MMVLKTDREIGLLRDAGQIAAEALAWAGRNAVPGRTTAELDAGVEAMIRARGGTPEFKGYHGFPASICASVNEEVVHGIPGNRALEEGDIISVDVGVRYRDFVGDTAWTFPVGEISAAARRLLKATEESLEAAIRAARVGGRLSEIARAVQRVAESYGYSLVKDYAGHGVGRQMHEEPQVPNFVDAHLLRNDVILEEGLVIAIEPMLCAGTGQTRVASDRWTVLTADGGLAAHFEHSVAFTSTGVEVLTRLEGGVS
ncbi:MAG TPA: type I methionyl aminopeptidase [Planctomycetota bacterium]|nr:type I methionyl aminopeptidase [Planctomycetota bacterium]